MKIILFLSIPILICCNRSPLVDNFYIISKHDSLLRIDPPPPPPPGLKYYSNIVLIFDTSNKVYLYQTELIDKEGKILDKSSGETWCCEEENFPFFINLKPSNLITIQADYLINFVKDNDDLFQLDTNFQETNRFMFLVSDFDTIENKGFYDLVDYIKTSKHVDGRIFYIVRRTSEEESYVLNCKRFGKPYNPEAFKWSSKFLDGKTKPFTDRYDSLEKAYPMRIKSKITIRENALKLNPIL